MGKPHSVDTQGHQYKDPHSRQGQGGELDGADLRRVVAGDDQPDTRSQQEPKHRCDVDEPLRGYRADSPGEAGVVLARQKVRAVCVTQAEPHHGVREPAQQDDLARSRQGRPVASWAAERIDIVQKQPPTESPDGES